MLTVSMRFPSGRFHATPWGSHVNEGKVEWPPAHWRILRALIATWHLKFKGRISRETLEEIVNALSEPPLYMLPHATTAHSRHYMPGGNHKEGLKRDVSLVLDSFVVIDREERTYIQWSSAELSDSAREALATLLSGLSYMGRAESWVIARLENGTAPGLNCFPVEEGEHVPFGKETVEVSSTMPASEYEQWQDEAFNGILELKLAEKKQKLFEKGKDTEKARLTSTDRKKVRLEVPPTLLDALEVSTADLRKSGWSAPPGQRMVAYARRSDCFSPVVARAAAPAAGRVKAVRYSVSGPVLPLLTQALWIGERVRTIVMGIAGRINDGAVPWVLSGKSSDGAPRQSDHRHAYYLCESCEGRGRISHITVYSRHGFEGVSLQALLSLRKVWGRSGYDLRLVPVETGDPADFGGVRQEKGESAILALSDSWISRTPFIPTRHPKLKGAEKNDPVLRTEAMARELKKQVRRELEYTGLPQPEEIELLEKFGTTLDGHFTAWLKFRTRRQKGGGSRVNFTGSGFTLRFAEPVRGPIVLGYASHFGLGQFVPSDTLK